MILWFLFDISATALCLCALVWIAAGTWREADWVVLPVYFEEPAATEYEDGAFALVTLETPHLIIGTQPRPEGHQ